MSDLEKEKFVLEANKLLGDYNQVSITDLDDFISSNAFNYYSLFQSKFNLSVLMNLLNYPSDVQQNFLNSKKNSSLIFQKQLNIIEENAKKRDLEELKRKEWMKTLVNLKQLTSIIPFSQKEILKLIDKKIISISAYNEFFRKGVLIKEPLFDPVHFSDIKIKIQDWKQSIKRKNLFTPESLVKSKNTRIFNQKIKKMNNGWMIFSKGILIKNFNQSYIIDKIQFFSDFSFKFKYDKNISFDKLLIELTNQDIIFQHKFSLVQKILNEINYSSFNSSELKYLSNAIYTFFLSNKEINESFFTKLNDFIKLTILYIYKNRNNDECTQLLDLKNYHNQFPLARSLNRKLHFISGPTNSGKTFNAINKFKNSHSGVYLAPLRLLAMEIFDKLNSEGIPCNLITGEEKILIPGAKHTSSTIETCNFNQIVDIAIIDEIQMLNDDSRGWAWSQALIGVPSKYVFMIGSHETLNSCKEIASTLNESLTTEIFERKNKLKLSKPISLKDIQPGDALIAFSRKQVLFYAKKLKQFNCSIIYGSLSPEVRRVQAELFASGKNQILVATDSIGMGLNLPIKRIIFSTTKKFNGNSLDYLSLSEIKQIAGRAGRFNLFKEGVYTSLTTNDFNFLKKYHNLSLDNQFSKIKILPSLIHLEKLSYHLNNHNLSELLKYFKNISFSHYLYDVYIDDNIIKLSQLCDKYHNLSLSEKFLCSCAPTNLNNKSELSFFKDILHSIDSKQTLKLPTLPSFALSTSQLDEAENFNKIISLYAWFSSKFPHLFIDYPLLNEYRNIINSYINQSFKNFDF